MNYILILESYSNYTYIKQEVEKDNKRLYFNINNNNFLLFVQRIHLF